MLRIVLNRFGMLFFLLCGSGAVVGATDAEQAAFAKRTASKYKLDEAWINKTLAAAEFQQAVRDAYKRTAESKPWSEYRPIFVTAKRAKAGRKFMAQHAQALARAEQEYGVPASVITAIIGVETFYGTYTGKYRVLDSLVSLAFYDWKRRKFFTRELQEFLALSAEGNVDPLTIKGSYAGAMGLPQFIASSYRAYSVDFDGDGKRNLLTSPVDAIGSVAAYLSRHGWQRGGAITERIVSPTRFPEAEYKRNKKPKVKLSSLRARGFREFPKLDPATPLMIVNLRGAQGGERWAVLNNFYVITRYNHSPLYAMAVTQLAQLLEPK
jgi:membrane-bound lytic murein transglycosylase B